VECLLALGGTLTLGYRWIGSLLSPVGVLLFARFLVPKEKVSFFRYFRGKRKATERRRKDWVIQPFVQWASAGRHFY